MKKKRNGCFPHLEGRLKLLRVMKLITFFLLAGLIQVSAGTYSQNIRLDIKTSSLSDVIQKIQEQTHLVFFYSQEDVAGVYVSEVKLNGATLDEALNSCLKGTNLDYNLMYNAVILHPRASNEDLKTPPGDNKVTGKVASGKGDPIPGVTVVVKGSTTGTITDADGIFFLDKVPDNAVLVFSFVGMKSREIKYSGQASLNITMEEKTEGIEEVIVVGYGVQKKISVSGSVSSVQTKELTQSSAASLDNALAGKLPGLTSIQTGGGQPGMDDATIYLRGASTLNGTSPLILIDGVPRDNIRTLDAHEVAAVSILKDASATALFGVRGANGVILITTRRGQQGKSDLSINVEQSYTSFTKEPERLHSWDYMKLRNEAFVNDGESPEFSDEVIAKYKDPLANLDPADPDYEEKARVLKYIYPDHNYYREFIKKNTPSTKVSANLSGGTDKVDYFMNASFFHQGGNLNTEPKSQLGYDPSSKMDRWTFRANLDYKISSSLSALLNLGTYIEKVNMPYVGSLYSESYSWMMRDLFYQAKTILPITPGPTTIAGFGYAPGQIVDPVYLDRSAFEVMNRRGYRRDVRSNLNSSFGLNWDLGKLITKGLLIKGMVSYDSYAGTTLEGGKSERLYIANVNYDTDELSYSVGRDTEDLLSVTKSANTQYDINLQGSVNYSRKFSKHDVGGMLLAQRDFWDHGGEIPHNVIGLSGRFTYNYDDRYFGEFDMGYNGSEQFAPSKRFGFFPAFSGGWVVSNEKFLKDNAVLTYLKLRASYGKVGNDQMGSNRFLYLDDTQIVSGSLSSLGKGKEVYEGIRGNKKLTWESAWKRNVGLDFQLSRNLNGSFDYFKEHRTHILITRHTVPTFQGVYLSRVPLQNMGVVDNHGYEIELNYTKTVRKDLSFIVRGNWSYNHNTVKNDDEVKRDDTYVYQTRTEGFSLSQPWGYKIDWKDHRGYWISEDEIQASGLTYDFGTPRAGDFKYIDMNKDGIINDKDQVPVGKPSIPRINYGVTLRVNWKAFDFSVFFQGVGQYYSMRSSQGIYENIKEGTYFDYHRHAWTLDRYLNKEKITYPALSTHSTTNHIENDFFIMNRAFTRLKNIELGYTLKNNACLSGLGIHDLRIYLSGHNLYVWDHQRIGGLDPENSDPIGYPVTRMVNFGANVNF